MTWSGLFELYAFGKWIGKTCSTVACFLKEEKNPKKRVSSSFIPSSKEVTFSQLTGLDKVRVLQMPVNQLSFSTHSYYLGEEEEEEEKQEEEEEKQDEEEEKQE